MKKSDFYFDLPHELIAQYPLKERSASRLFAHNRQSKQNTHYQFSDLPDLLNPGDLLVMNNSKVIPARFYGTKASGGRVEFLVERLIDTHQFLAHIKASKAPKALSIISLDGDYSVQVLEKKDDLYHCAATIPIELLLDKIGHIPLPPYINRPDEDMDFERYQTVYAEYQGSVAAPTAGLHFDVPLLQRLHDKGIQTAFTTLHVGAGTFRPLRSESIFDHKMHKEQLILSEELCNKVHDTKISGKRVIAVGTTALRSLEAAAVASAALKPGAYETDIFIYPGFDFKICDGLITNFHLPESTLVILVAAFIGHKEVMSLYEEAIAKQYRFFSYGDASLLL